MLKLLSTMRQYDTNVFQCDTKHKILLCSTMLRGNIVCNKLFNFYCLRFLVNATLGSTLSSPLESPDIMQRFIPVNDIGAATTSMASIKLSSGDSLNIKSQQVRPIRLSTYSNPSTRKQFYSTISPSVSSSIPQSQFHTNSNTSAILISATLNNDHVMNTTTTITTATTTGDSKSSSLKTIHEYAIVESMLRPTTSTMSVQHNFCAGTSATNFNGSCGRNRDYFAPYSNKQSLLEFSLSSVGRSFIDETDEIDEVAACESLHTPDTPTPNISPSSSSNRFSETFSNDFIKAPSTPSIQVSPLSELAHKKFLATVSDDRTNVSGQNYAGSWDLLELDLNFHEVNFDPSFGGDVEEKVFFGDDPLGILPPKPTLPDSHDL